MRTWLGNRLEILEIIVYFLNAFALRAFRASWLCVLLCILGGRPCSGKHTDQHSKRSVIENAQAAQRKCKKQGKKMLNLTHTHKNTKKS